MPPMTAEPGSFDTGIPSPVTIDSSTLPLPDRTTPSTGSFSPGPHPQPVADGDRVERHVVLAPGVAQAVCGRRRQLQQQAQRGSSTAPGAQLQHLAEQHQGGDGGRALEVVQGDGRAGPGGRAAEDAGRHGRRHAVEVGDRDPEADQGEHVQAAVDDGGPAALEEGEGAPQHHRAGQRQLQPAEPGGGGHWREGQDDQRRGEECAHNQAARHVAELAVIVRPGGHRPRFQRHAARGTGAGTRLVHFRVHRAGVPRGGAAGACGSRVGSVPGHVRTVVVVMRLGPVSMGVLVPMAAVVRRLVSVVVAGVWAAILVRMARGVFVMCAVVLVHRARLFQEAHRIGAEPGPAACRAEPVGLAVVLQAVRAVRRDGHAADRVDVRHDQKSERPSTAINSSTTRGQLGAIAPGGVRHAVVEVPLEHVQAKRVEGRAHGGHLGQDVDAVALLLDHATDPGDLPLNAAQPAQRRLIDRMGAAPGCDGRHRFVRYSFLSISRARHGTSIIPQGGEVHRGIRGILPARSVTAPAEFR